MIPLKDDVKTRTFPIITTSVVFVNMLLFGWQRLFLSRADNEALFRQYGLIPREILLSITSNWEVIPHNMLTVLTSMFLHGGLFHLAGNMIYLWIFGRTVEDAMGHRRFILFFLMSGIVAALFQFFYDPSSEIPLIGASGAVSGVLGGYLVLFPLARVKTMFIIVILIKILEVPAIILLTGWFLMQIIFSYTEDVAWHAHIGGFIFGLVFIKVFARRTPRKRRA
jgi:membrane associated rhomboid family serine protease